MNWQRLVLVAIVVAGLVVVLVTDSAKVGAFVAALNAFLPPLLGTGKGAADES